MSPYGQKKVKTRRLSPLRILIAILLVGAAIGIGLFGWREWRIDPSLRSNKPWFAPYVDVTASPQFAFEQLGSGTYKDAVLSFVVASHDDGCKPSWGGEYTVEQASNDLDLDRRIARLEQQGGTVAISFGGLKNDELATTCSDEGKLLNAYRSMIDHYDVTTVDLDLEKESLTDPIVNLRRAGVIAKLQTEQRKSGKPFAVWATVPVTSQGLSKDGLDAVTALLKSGVDLAGVNIMTMNYSSAETAGKRMSDVAISSIKSTQRQLSILYDQQGTHLNDVSLWRKIGITPMIGQSNSRGEVFTLDDAKRLNAFAHDVGTGRMSMWSANRDVECGSNYVDTSVVSDSCSGVKQSKYQFMELLGDGFTGNILGTADIVTVAEKKPTAEELVDNPETSPYPIWLEDGAYLAGAKVVWHHNVYQAKWWTKGDSPDNPVLQAWQTPWELIGPVLTGEKPIQQATLPAGTYPDWSGDAAYETGQRIIFQGVPYQAKWWNRAASPAAASSNSESSPWQPLTQAEIEKVIKSLQ